ncbi:MAG: hypothetical protein ACF8QF_03710 [Phycisphaerales bacterium]
MLEPKPHETQPTDGRAVRVLVLLLACVALQTVDILTLYRLMETTGVWVESVFVPGAPFWLGSGDSMLLTRAVTLTVCLGGLYGARRNWLAEIGAIGVFALSILLLARWSMYLDLVDQLHLH